jgi:hypothetical protein
VSIDLDIAVVCVLVFGQILVVKRKPRLIRVLCPTNHVQVTLPDPPPAVPTIKTRFTLLLGFILLVATRGAAQSDAPPSEIAQITATLMDYIDGTAEGDIDRLRRAFHLDFKLYTVNAGDSLVARSGEAYIAGCKPGVKTNRIGRIIAIDYEKDAATAKAEILIPGWRVFTDYFLLLKYEGAWKIVQKSYTWRELPK